MSSIPGVSINVTLQRDRSWSLYFRHTVWIFQNHSSSLYPCNKQDNICFREHSSDHLKANILQAPTPSPPNTTNWVYRIRFTIFWYLGMQEVLWTIDKSIPSQPFHLMAFTHSLSSQQINTGSMSAEEHAELQKADQEMIKCQPSWPQYRTCMHDQQQK